MTCPNCGRKLSCSCKLRRASDGKNVCANCITTYELSIKQKNSSNSSNSTGTILNVKAE